MNTQEISILVVDDDEEYARELSSYFKCCNNVSASEYALNGEIGADAANLLRPDVIVLDAVMPVLDGIGFLRRLSHMQLSKKPIIIMTSYASVKSMLEAAASYGVDYFMLKPQRFSEMYNTICDLAATNVSDKVEDEKENTLEKHITMYLKNLGVPMHLSGYKYMRSAMAMTMEDVSILTPITKKLYPMLANEHNTSKECVERGIRHAIGVSWKRGNKKLLRDVFGYSSEDTNIPCPTNSEYIAMASDDFRIKMKYGMLEKDT